MKSIAPRWFSPVALLLAAVSAAAVWAPGDRAPAPFRHPHFQKTLTCTLKKGLDLTARYMTVTFDKAGAEKMEPGQAWHLAGAMLELGGELTIGGNKVAAGKYALSARKAEKGWELTLHEGNGFSRPGADAIVLETEFTPKTLKFEHLNVDVQPGGDKKNTEVFLEVRFDEMLARCLIEIPE